MSQENDDQPADALSVTPAIDPKVKTAVNDFLTPIFDKITRKSDKSSPITVNNQNANEDAPADALTVMPQANAPIYAESFRMGEEMGAAAIKQALAQKQEKLRDPAIVKALNEMMPKLKAWHDDYEKNKAEKKIISDEKIAEGSKLLTQFMKVLGFDNFQDLYTSVNIPEKPKDTPIQKAAPILAQVVGNNAVDILRKMDMADGKKNAYVTMEGFQQVLSTLGNGDGKAGMTVFLKSMDSNQDGKVDGAEARAALINSGLANDKNIGRVLNDFGATLNKAGVQFSPDMLQAMVPGATDPGLKNAPAPITPAGGRSLS